MWEGELPIPDPSAAVRPRALEQARGDLGVVVSRGNAGGVQAVQEPARMTKDIRKLSGAQLYALDLASRYKLQAGRALLPLHGDQQPPAACRSGDRHRCG